MRHKSELGWMGYGIFPARDERPEFESLADLIAYTLRENQERMADSIMGVRPQGKRYHIERNVQCSRAGRACRGMLP